jgi:hypothetical protein
MTEPTKKPPVSGLRRFFVLIFPFSGFILTFLIGRIFRPQHEVSHRTEALIEMAVALLICTPVLVSTSLWLRRSLGTPQSRLSRGCCPRCGYDLSGKLHVCPKCGATPENWNRVAKVRWQRNDSAPSYPRITIALCLLIAIGVPVWLFSVNAFESYRPQWPVKAMVIASSVVGLLKARRIWRPYRKSRAKIR